MKSHKKIIFLETIKIFIWYLNLEMLAEEPELKEIYKIISKSICHSGQNEV